MENLGWCWRVSKNHQRNYLSRGRTHRGITTTFIANDLVPIPKRYRHSQRTGRKWFWYCRQWNRTSCRSRWSCDHLRHPSRRWSDHQRWPSIKLARWALYQRHHQSSPEYSWLYGYDCVQAAFKAEDHRHYPKRINVNLLIIWIGYWRKGIDSSWFLVLRDQGLATHPLGLGTRT